MTIDVADLVVWPDRKLTEPALLVAADYMSMLSEVKDLQRRVSQLKMTDDRTVLVKSVNDLQRRVAVLGNLHRAHGPVSLMGMKARVRQNRQALLEMGFEPAAMLQDLHDLEPRVMSHQKSRGSETHGFLTDVAAKATSSWPPAAGWRSGA